MAHLTASSTRPPKADHRLTGGSSADTPTSVKTAPAEANQSTTERAEDRRREQARVIHAINEALRGPVLDIYRTLLPQLGPLSYEDVLATPGLVDGCFRLFEKRRDTFAALLVTDSGLPVADDDTPLSCGRSVAEIRTLVVRTSAKKYFRTHGDRFGDVEEHKRRPDTKVNTSLLARLFELVASLWQGRDGRRTAHDDAARRARIKADQLYEEMAPYLRHDWQVSLIPYYATLPRTLIAEMGEGLLSLRRPEDLEFLLRIGRANFNEAQNITGELSREMLDTDPRAARGVTHVGGKEYERLLNGLHGRMGGRFWKVFTATELLDSLGSKSTADIVEMAAHLDRMGSDSVDYLVQFLQRPQIAPFLSVAETALGSEVFNAVFGTPGDPKLARIFAQKAAQLRVDRDDPEDFGRKLTFIFQAYHTSPDDFAKTL